MSRQIRCQGSNLNFPIGPKPQMIEKVANLLSARFCRILLSGYRGEVENGSGNQGPTIHLDFLIGLRNTKSVENFELFLQVNYRRILFSCCRGEGKMSQRPGHLVFRSAQRGKGRYLTQSYYKSPYTNRKKKHKQLDNTKTPPATFDYTTSADRLRTVSWSNDRYPTGVVKPINGIPTFPLTAKLCNQKDTNLNI